MNSYIKERTLNEARYLFATKQTIRQTAKIFGVSKSTVHNDLSKRLKVLNKELYENVKDVLDVNFDEKHIRGGISTKMKFEKLKNN
jgi:putative DeoR family transcriptional regulator (stage III sporulation protein D)